MGKGRDIYEAAKGELLGYLGGAQTMGITDTTSAPPGVRRRGRAGTRSGMIAMPARMPTARQWKKINQRLHDYRKVAIGIIHRTGGMNKPHRGGGYRRSYRAHERRR